MKRPIARGMPCRLRLGMPAFAVNMLKRRQQRGLADARNKLARAAGKGSTSSPITARSDCAVDSRMRFINAVAAAVQQRQPCSGQGSLCSGRALSG